MTWEFLQVQFETVFCYYLLVLCLVCISLECTLFLRTNKFAVAKSILAQPHVLLIIKHELPLP